MKNFSSSRVKSGLTFVIFILFHGQISIYNFISEDILQNQAFDTLKVKLEQKYLLC